MKKSIFKKLGGLFLGLAMGLGVAVGVAAGNKASEVKAAETKELTFDLSKNPGSWPTTASTTLTNYTYTLNGTAYTFGLKNVKCNSGYLMLNYTAALGLPAIEGYKLTKVVAKNSGGCSTSTKVGVSSSASSASYISGGAILTWSTTNSSYTYTLNGTSNNTVYYLYVTNKNAQITQLALTYEAPKTLSSITVSEDHRSFTVGDTFVKETVTAHYSDSSTADVTSSANFSGFNMSQTGNQTVTVTYVENSVTKTTTYSITVNSADSPSATLTPDEESYNVGDSFSISANFNEYCTGTTSVSVISEDEEKVFNTFYIDNVLTGDFRLAGEVTFKAYNDSTVVGTITVCVGLSGDLKAVTKVPKIGGYSKVTKTSNLTDGQYLIVCENQNVAFNGGLQTLDAVSNTVAISISNDRINLNGDVDLSSAEFTFTASNGSFKGTSGKYFGNSSNSNGLTSSEAALTNTVSVSNGNVDILSSGGAYLRYNKTSGQTRFRYYKSSTYTSQEPIQLYKFSSGEGFSYNEQDVSPSLYNFVRQVYTCDYNGSSEISSWDDAKSLYMTLCDNGSLDNTDKINLKTCVSKDPNNETKTTFSLLSDFITKYDRYVCEYLESDQLTTIDYLERFTTEGAGDRSLGQRVSLLNNLIFESNSSTWIIAVISVVGLSAIGGYFFYRKRKEI